MLETSGRLYVCCLQCLAKLVHFNFTAAVSSNMLQPSEDSLNRRAPVNNLAVGYAIGYASDVRTRNVLLG
jgi:hypothetical protein